MQGDGDNPVAIYNSLVKEAQGLGINDYRLVRRFADSATADKRIRELAETVEAAKDRIKNPPADAASNDATQQTKETDMTTKTATAKKAAKKAPAKTAKTVKKVAKGARTKVTGSTAAPTKAASPLHEQLLGRRSGGTNKANLLSVFAKHIGKPISREALQKELGYKDDNIGAFRMCLAGLIATVNQPRTGYVISQEKKDGKIIHTFAKK